MSDVMTKSMARNVFYGGSLFFIAIFGAMSVHSLSMPSMFRRTRRG